MALVMSIVKFDAPAPKPDEIIKKVFELTGLKLVFVDDSQEYREYNGEIYVEGFEKKHPIELYAYHVGAIKKSEDKFSDGMEYISPFTTEGYHDCDGVQRVYLRGYLGQELTLMGIITKALIDLDGDSECFTKENLEGIDMNITIDELEKRYQELETYHKKRKPLYYLYGFFSILSLPFMLIWTLLTFPYTLYKVFKEEPKLWEAIKKSKQED